MQLTPIEGLPMVTRGNDIGELILRAADKQGLRFEDGDLVAIAQTIVSKAEGAVVDLRTVTPSKRAEELAVQLAKDSRLVEVILQQSTEIVRLGRVLISRTRHGFVCANAGVDQSNVDEELVTLLPNDSDLSATRIRETIKRGTGANVAVIITDTQGRAWREGCVGVAIGVAGIHPLLDLRGSVDLFGKELKVTVTSPADSLAAAAVSIMGEANEGTPVILIRGAKYRRGYGSIREVVRALQFDLFR